MKILIFSVVLNKLYSIVGLVSTTMFVKNLIFYLIWLSLVMGTIKTTIVFFITIDRVFAFFSPIFYHKHRNKISMYLVLFFISLFVFFDQFMLFGYCGNVIDVPVNCENFQCTVNQCYLQYWMVHEQVVFFVISSLSTILFVRLFVCNFLVFNQSSKLISKVRK